MNRIACCTLIMIALIVSPATAEVITFDELPGGTPVDGMVIGNVTFGFTSADATIDGGPGTTAFIEDPNIEGDANGILTLLFATPVLNVSYGFALNEMTPFDPGTTMELFDVHANPLGSYSQAAGDFGFGFVEGENSAASATPIKSAEISFGNNSRFAFDNLTFTVVPEPSTLACGLITGLAGCGYRIKRRLAAA